MSRRPIELLVAVGSKLVRLPKPIAFVGGATTGLHVTDPAAPSPRATLDVDIIVSVNGVAEYAKVIAPARRPSRPRPTPPVRRRRGDAHRADLHQALAYASLSDVEREDSTLVYPTLPFGIQSRKHRDRALVELRELLAVG
jgi:hypothetical protein